MSDRKESLKRLQYHFLIFGIPGKRPTEFRKPASAAMWASLWHFGKASFSLELERNQVSTYVLRFFSNTMTFRLVNGVFLVH